MLVTILDACNILSNIVTLELMKARDKILKFLDKNDFITTEEACQMGANKMTLSRLTAREEVHRVAGRIYAKHYDWLTDPLKKYAPACTLYPDAVICCVSALTYYELTDEIEKKIWLAFPQSHRIVNKEYRMVYPSDHCHSLGINIHKLGKRKIRIYDREKSVIDAFKYLPVDVAHKALKGYLNQKNPDHEKLSKYARKMKKNIDKEITFFLADE